MRITTMLPIIASCVLIGTIGQANAAKNAAREDHINVPLNAIGGSGITGHVELMKLPKGGTRIIVHAKGLNPGDSYLSLYYENHTCEVEPYEPEDVIAHYQGNGGGTAMVTKDVEDAIDDINSVSVRADPAFTLLACADTHPGD